MFRSPKTHPQTTRFDQFFTGASIGIIDATDVRTSMNHGDQRIHSKGKGRAE